MYEDIVNRLRDQALAPILADLCTTAADAIERLRAEVDLKGNRIDFLNKEVVRLRAKVVRLDEYPEKDYYPSKRTKYDGWGPQHG